MAARQVGIGRRDLREQRSYARRSSFSRVDRFRANSPHEMSSTVEMVQDHLEERGRILSRLIGNLRTEPLYWQARVKLVRRVRPGAGWQMALIGAFVVAVPRVAFRASMLSGPDSPHFHIHWSTKGAPDWQRFSAHVEAHSRALELIMPAESFTVERYSGNCPACQWLRDPGRGVVRSAGLDRGAHE